MKWKTEQQSLEILTMCNSRGASAQTKSSEEELSNLQSASVTGGDVVGIKSCTSARTGGGEGCLVIPVCRGLSIASKDIKEPGSSTWVIWQSLFSGFADSSGGIWLPTLISSFLMKIPFSMGLWPLLLLEILKYKIN